VQRGNNRQICFTGAAEFKAFAHWLRAGADKYGVAVHAWVFMTNHVHLLLTPKADDSVSRCMQYLGRHYVPYYNHRHRRSGTLFEGRFRSSIVQTRSYLLACQRYIELNPVRARMVSDPADYAWSSYRGHAFGRGAKMWRPHPEYLSLGGAASAREAAYRRFFGEQFPEQLITDIRAALKTGLVLGDNRFRREVERLTGQRQQLLPRGPRPHKSERAPD